MTPNPVLDKCRQALACMVSWRKKVVLLSVIGALTSLALVSFARFDERAGMNTPGSRASSDKRRQPQGQALGSALKQDETPMAGAVRVNLPAVKPKIFRGDVRRLPLVKPKIKKPMKEPKDPGPELPARLGPDAVLQAFGQPLPRQHRLKTFRAWISQIGVLVGRRIRTVMSVQIITSKQSMRRLESSIKPPVYV